MDETSAMVSSISFLGMHAAFAIGGVVLLKRRVWELGVSALMVGAGIPGLVLLIGYTGLVTNLWQFILAILALMCLAWAAMQILPRLFPCCPTAPMAT